MIETDIMARLAADSDISDVVGTRMYCSLADQRATVPYIVIHTISRRRFPSSAGVNSMVSTRLQIDCIESTYLKAKVLADHVRVNLNDVRGVVGSSFIRSCLLDSENAIGETPFSGKDKGRERVSLDFVVVHTESTA